MSAQPAFKGEAVHEIKSCRCCGGGDLVSVFDLGQMPLSDGFVKHGTGHEPTYPLEVWMCRSCGLAQLKHTVAPEILFADDYPYFSSFTQTVVDNAKVNVHEAVERFNPPKDGLIIELASNDGYLLKHAAALGYKTLGIDPAKGPVEAARNAGIDTVHAFFTEGLALKLAGEGKKADLIFGNNVLAHVADTGGFVRGIKAMLKQGGTCVIEAPYLKDLIDHNEFDTIYHEHLCYFSVTALRALFQQNGLALVDVKWIPIHGGSIRMFIQHEDKPTDRLKAALAEEKKLGLDGPAAFKAFEGRVNQMGKTLRDMLIDLKKQGKRVAGYGAAAKGTILLNHFRIDSDLLMWVADKNHHKQGLWIPGVKLEVVDPARIAVDKPDYLVILPWNHKDEIMRQQAQIKDWGGKFIIPVPTPVVVG
jgi:SAM-dependent methyltransferase